MTFKTTKVGETDPWTGHCSLTEWKSDEYCVWVYLEREPNDCSNRCASVGIREEDSGIVIYSATVECRTFSPEEFLGNIAQVVRLMKERVLHPDFLMRNVRCEVNIGCWNVLNEEIS